MKLASASVTLLLAGSFLALAGCGSGGTSPATSGTSNPFASRSGSSGQAQYTILLCTFNEPTTHSQDAKTYKSRLEQATRWQGMFILDRATDSSLFMGQFRAPQDAKSTLDRVKKYRTQNNLQIFNMAILVPIPGTQVGLPEWDLARNKGAYSYLVAIYQNDPKAQPPYLQCQQDAVAACKSLRDQGYEAYYFHGVNDSSVTIGTFGPNAIREQAEQVQTSADPQPITVRKVVVVDPGMLDIKQKFPSLAWNGHQSITVSRGQDGKDVRTIDETYPVRVPKTK